MPHGSVLTSVRYALLGSLVGFALVASGCPRRIAPSIGTGSEACRTRVAANLDEPAALRLGVDRDGAAFAALAEQVLAARARAVALVVRMTAAEASGPFRGADLDELKQRLRDGLERIAALESLAAANDCWIDVEDFATDPSTRRDGSTVGLAASLLLYDTYAATVSVLNEDERIRRFLNQSDLGYGVAEDQLDTLTDAHLSIAGRLRAREQIAFSEAHPGPPSRPAIEYAALFVRQSPSYSALLDLGPRDALGERATRVGRRSQDELAAVGQLGVDGLSRVFGNSVGMVQVRDGVQMNTLADFLDVDGSVLELVALYHDGEQVTDEPTKMLAELMRESGS